jgi:di/tricarboxylate transporter
MFEMIYTGLVVVLMTTFLILEISRASLVMFTSLVLLVLGNIISLDEAFSGFSNQGMLTVGILFIVAAALQSSTKFENTVINVLGKANYAKGRYFRLMLPVSGLSAFLNNTPIVASLIPVISTWAKRNHLPTSKFLIPLSYAAILGGMCTLIGTSTNLIIHGMMLDEGMQGFSFFELGKVGLPIAIFGILYFSTFGHALLPERKDSMTNFEETSREFVVEMAVNENYPFIGKSVEEANLRHLQGLFLFQVIRDNQTIAPVTPTERIYLGDRLFFTGLPETIFELQKTPGLRVIKDTGFDFKNIDSDKLKTFEAVISNVSPLTGQTVRESNFRRKYNAVILGIHRGDSRVNKKIGDIVLQGNDTLFLLAKSDFGKKWYHSKDFSLVSSSYNTYSKPEKKGNVALVLLILMVLAAALKILPMLVAAALAAIIMIAARIISVEDAKSSVDVDVLLVIASALGIGLAIQNSGLAHWIANGLINWLQPIGMVGILAGVFVATSLYTEFITNNAGAAIMFPIALATAQQLQLDPKAFMITVAIGASASFATPMGYQTNLLVYKVGRYRFMDFIKTGLIMNLWVGVLTVGLVYYFYF